jgi:AraC family transcriptional regulator
MEVRFENCKPLRVAYIRHIGPYMECGPAWQKVYALAGQQGLIGPNTMRIGIGHDNPKVTPAEKLRYDACLTIGDEAQPAGDLQVQVLPGGEYAIVTHRGSYTGLPDAYRQIFGEWIQSSGRKMRQAPCFEIYVNSPTSTADESLITEIYVPLESR